jgi:predicted DNA-binding ribbon-helix-helix protein
MAQSQVWKKRPAELASELRVEARSWLYQKDSERDVPAAVPAGQRKAGVKRRRY